MLQCSGNQSKDKIRNGIQGTLSNAMEYRSPLSWSPNQYVQRQHIWRIPTTFNTTRISKSERKYFSNSNVCINCAVFWRKFWTSRMETNQQHTFIFSNLDVSKLHVPNKNEQRCFKHDEISRHFERSNGRRCMQNQTNYQ